jgi:quercetin dioxygenase-like cupin family protein
MRRRALAIFWGALLGVPAAGRAQDPVPLYPENYKVLLENDRVRVLDFTLRKGDSEQPHFHPANVAVFLADFKIRFTLPDGSMRMREGHPGQVAWSDAVVHQPVNVGDTDAQASWSSSSRRRGAPRRRPRGRLPQRTMANASPRSR